MSDDRAIAELENLRRCLRDALASLSALEVMLARPAAAGGGPGLPGSGAVSHLLVRPADSIALVDGFEVPLTKMEFRALALLWERFLVRPRAYVTFEEFDRALWPELGGTNAQVRNLICRLNRKVGGIENRPGVGYRLTPRD